MVSVPVSVHTDSLGEKIILLKTPLLWLLIARDLKINTPNNQLLADAYKMVLEENLMVKDLRAVIQPRAKKAKEKIKKAENIENQTHRDEARESRGTWKHPLDFLFSCISVSVGLGSMYSICISRKYIISYFELVCSFLTLFIKKLK